MELTHSEKNDVSARIERLERTVVRLIDVIEQSTLVARADQLAGPTPGLGTVGERLSAALLEISEPEVLGALTRIATLAPQLEAAAHAAAAAPELLEEAVDMVRKRVGPDDPARMQALSEALSQLGKPEVTRALGQLAAAAPALAGPLTTAAQTVSEVRKVLGPSALDENLRELTRTVLDPEVTQALTRLAGLIPQLEYAAFGAAALPELLDEGLEIVRKKTAQLNDGVPLQRRLDALTQLALKLSAPQLVQQLGDVAERALPVVDKLSNVPPATIEQALELLKLAAAPELQAPLGRLFGSLPALTEALLALPTEPSTLAFLKRASHAVGEVMESGAPPVGLWGALSAMRDPKIQAAVGFALALARGVGEILEEAHAVGQKRLPG